MDLNVHRLITFKAYKKYLVKNQKTNDPDYLTNFHDLWMGNWLTDMNQATAFFSAISFFDKESATVKLDYYDAWDADEKKYVLPLLLRAVSKFRVPWENLIGELWNKEWNDTLTHQRKYFDSIKISQGGAQTGNAEAIGCYFPMDHFDVTEKGHGREDWTDNESNELNAITPESPWSHTAKGGIVYALNGWIEEAFKTVPGQRHTHSEALKKLGHGLHTLQDFFAHSNYPELLLLAVNQECNLESINPVLSESLSEQIRDDTQGTFNSFPFFNKAIDNPILTGRFDTIDTVYTLAGKYKNHLLESAWNNTDSDVAMPKMDEEQTLQVLFGTFSNIDIVTKLEGTATTFVHIRKSLKELNQKIKSSVIDLFNFAATKFFNDNPKMKHSVDLMSELSKSVFKSTTNKSSYEKAGKLMYLEYSIENFLKEKVEMAETQPARILPHHSLLAKDHVVLNAEVRLAFKLGCVLATELSYEILNAYYRGKDFSEVNAMVNRMLAHPKDILTDPTRIYEKDHIMHKIDQLYAGRWWKYEI